MSGNSNSRLLLTGIGPRLAVAILVSAMLWGGFYWATSGVGV